MYFGSKFRQYQNLSSKWWGGGFMPGEGFEINMMDEVKESRDSFIPVCVDGMIHNKYKNGE